MIGGDTLNDVAADGLCSGSDCRDGVGRSLQRW